MPITRSVNEEFAKSYNVPIVINEDDSDSVKAVKHAVMELREEVAAIIESEGLSVYDIYTRHQDLMREVVMLRKIAQKEVLSIYNSGDMEKVHHYVQDANKILRSAGADEIKVPSETESEATKRLKENLYRLKQKN
jgi:predicted class III extradiol MEMO1 family dioxygenase